MGILPTIWIDKIIYFVSCELCYLWCFDTCGSLIGEFKPLNWVNIFPKQGIQYVVCEPNCSHMNSLGNLLPRRLRGNLLCLKIGWITHRKEQSRSVKGFVLFRSQPWKSKLAKINTVYKQQKPGMLLLLNSQLV